MDLVEVLEQKLDHLLKLHRAQRDEIATLRAENAKLGEERRQAVVEIDRILAKLDEV